MVFFAPRFFGNFPFEARAPIQWQDNKVPKYATSHTRQLSEDIQALRPLLEGVPDEGFNISEFFTDGSALRLELASFDFAIMRHLTLTTDWHPHPLTRNSTTHTPRLETSFGDVVCSVRGCTRRFATATSVACHLRKSADTAHGVIQPLSALAVASERPLCLSRFTNKWTTVLHLQSSYRKLLPVLSPAMTLP